MFALFLGPLAGISFAKPNPVPVPPSEYGLMTIPASEYFVASPERHTLEGAIFDAKGNLIFCDVTARKVMAISPEQKLSEIVQLDEVAPGGLAFHPDGRLFMAALNLDKGKGGIFALNKNGKIEEIIPPQAGYMPNDLVFTKNGGFYFSDFKGQSTDPKGGIYYVSPDFASISPVAQNMGQANGIALSPDGKILWATEYSRNLLHRFELASPVSLTPTGSKIPYHFIGAGPDSMRVDADGNVYVAMMGQGRVLIFNKNGLPVGQILLPEREMGRNLRSASLALHPDRNEAYIVAGNTPDSDRSDARIFKAPALAPALPALGLTGAF